jgi:lysophospholipase L1-like esterase
MKPRRAQRCLEWDRLEDRICQSSGSIMTVAGTVPSASTNGSFSPTQLRLDEQFQEQIAAASNAQLTAAGQPVPGPNASITPTPNLVDPVNISDFLQYQAEAATLKPNVIFLGDSIFWRFTNQEGGQAWNQKIAPLNALAFGIAGDTTQNLLWRIENGELASHPKVAVVEVGLNNLGLTGGYEPVDETVAGVKAVVTTIRTLSPSTKVLLLGIFPTGEPNNWLRGLEYATNLQLAQMANGSTVRFLNPGWNLVGPGQSLAANISSDLIHPNPRGYALVAASLVPTLVQMIGPQAYVASAARLHK